MSVFRLRIDFLTIKPKVWMRGDHLYARTSYPIQALTLGAFARKLHLDGERRTVEIDDVRLWWFRRRREFSFDRVAYIDTSYQDIGVKFGWTDQGFGRLDKWERFRVGLCLKDPTERVKLFSFAGDGVVKTGAVGVLYGGDALVDSYGDQADHCRFFVARLQALLGVPVGPLGDLPVPDPKSGLHYRCSVCRRPSISTCVRCWSCGGAIEAMIPSVDDATAERPTTDGDDRSAVKWKETADQTAAFEEAANA